MDGCPNPGAQILEEGESVWGSKQEMQSWEGSQQLGSSKNGYKRLDSHRGLFHTGPLRVQPVCLLRLVLTKCTQGLMP